MRPLPSHGWRDVGGASRWTGAETQTVPSAVGCWPIRGLTGSRTARSQISSALDEGIPPSHLVKQCRLGDCGRASNDLHVVIVQSFPYSSDVECLHDRVV